MDLPPARGGCGDAGPSDGAGRRAVPALQMGQYSTDGITGGTAFKRRHTSGGTDSFALVTVTGDATCAGKGGGYRPTADGRHPGRGGVSVSAVSLSVCQSASCPVVRTA